MEYPITYDYRRRIVQTYTGAGRTRRKFKLASFDEVGIEAEQRDGEWVRWFRHPPHWWEAKFNRLMEERGQALYARLEREGAIGASSASSDRVSVLAAWSTYLGEKQGSRSPKTLKEDWATHRDWQALMGDMPLAGLTEDTVDQFRVALGTKPGTTSPRTVNKHLAHLSAFLTWARRRRLMGMPPVIEKERVTHRQLRLPSKADIARLVLRIQWLKLTSTNPHHSWAYHLHERALMAILGCGLRQGELVPLEWGRTIVEGFGVHVRETGDWTPKGRHERSVPALDGFLAYMQRLRKWRPKERYYLCTRDGQSRAYPSGNPLALAFRNHWLRLGYKDREFTAMHSLRGHILTDLARRGMSPYMVQAFAGHQDFRTTQGYLALAGEDLEEAVRRVGQD